MAGTAAASCQLAMQVQVLVLALVLVLGQVVLPVALEVSLATQGERAASEPLHLHQGNPVQRPCLVQEQPAKQEVQGQVVALCCQPLEGSCTCRGSRLALQEGQRSFVLPSSSPELHPLVLLAFAVEWRTLTSTSSGS